jgi:choline-sulfatase
MLAAPVLAAALLAAGCHRAAADRPSILLVTLDTTRADHCSAYGYGRPTTPHLDALARRGVRFEAAYAPTASTGPSHASMFTGLLPLWHGVLKNGQALGEDRTTLAERLHAAGYRTAAVVSSFAVDRRFGFAQGFDSYDDRFSGKGVTHPNKVWEGNVVGKPFDRRAEETRARAMEWLAGQGDLAPRHWWTRDPAPFFLWVHFFDAHAPYDPPASHAALFPPQGETDVDRSRAAYDAEVHYADEEMGRILDALAAAGTLDRTLVVVAGDHGEGLMAHGHMNHGVYIYEEAVRVPLVFHWPGGGARPATVAAPVELVDLTPTLLALAGLPPMADGNGRSLASVLRQQETADSGREIFLQRRRYDDRIPAGIPVKGDKYGLRAGRWKYIEAREEDSYELFDLLADPAESHNLRPSDPEQAALMSRRLGAWTSRAPNLPALPVTPEDAERLRAMGYVQ